jgi:hypothetical protein
MTPKDALIAHVIRLLAVVAVAASVAPALLAQRSSQGVVTPGDPLWAPLTAAQDPQEPQEPAPAAEESAAPAGRGRGAGPAPPQPRPYNQVITSDARTNAGIFTVHRIREQLYYEIPKAELGRDFLWVSQIKRTTVGAGYGGQAAGNRVVRWDLVGNRVLLRLIDYTIVADPGTPIARAVADANNPAIMRAPSTWPPSARRATRSSRSRRSSSPRSRSCRCAAGWARGIRSEPHVPRARRGVPGEHQRRGASDVHRAGDTGDGAGPDRRAGRGMRGSSATSSCRTAW